jgi:hypothetical protein
MIANADGMERFPPLLPQRFFTFVHRVHGSISFRLILAQYICICYFFSIFKKFSSAMCWQCPSLSPLPLSLSSPPLHPSLACTNKAPLGFIPSSQSKIWNPDNATLYFLLLFRQYIYHPPSPFINPFLFIEAKGMQRMTSSVSNQGHGFLAILLHLFLLLILPLI